MTTVPLETGPQVGQLVFRLYRDAPFTFDLDQTDETGAPLAYDPTDPPQLVFPELGVTWTAAVASNAATWDVPWSDPDLTKPQGSLIPRGAWVELWVTKADQPRAAGVVILGGQP